MYLEFFKNDGAGNFIKETITSGGIGGNHNLLDQHYITPFNYDGDNDEDILLYDTKLTNIGNGLFDISGSIWNIGKPNTFDIDGDRDLDFITLNFYAGIYKNDGSGNFQREPGSFLEDWMEKLTSADLDNDGDLDMVTVKNNTLRTYMNNESPCISGPELIVTNSVNLYYTEPSSEVYWDISNFESTQATIISNNHNDSIYVNAGNNFGHFVLYLIMTDSILCTKHVYIDNPAPVEISAFNSSVSRSDVSLLWSTSSEINNSGFEIEKTNVTGQTTNEWSKVGFVSGGGTTNEMREYSFTDRNLTTGKYKYRLKQLDFNGNFEYYELSEEVSIGIPDKYDLSQNYPNPFNPVTTINYDLPTDGIVTIKVFDLLGREIKTLVNEMKNAGYYKLTFNASDLSSGAYFYRMTSEDFVSVKKFVVLK
ncbi:MAG: T9SS type A sorting domain-containing protein [Ignavibacteria bacterium]|nr:T9SS type A sorting domain-containing protein [Ignavibacteria bacterium]